MSASVQIRRVSPPAAAPGGEVLIECEGFDTSRLGAYSAHIGGEQARLVGASTTRVLASVPEELPGGDAEVELESGGERSEPARLLVGTLLAEDLHMVASPAFDPADGSLYVTRSGSRGHREPVSLFRVGAGGLGGLEDVTGEITNPTGMAFDATGQLYVSSRNDGAVYRVSRAGEVVPFAQDLGIATGLAFDRRGRLYVGDRTGTIHRVNGIGQAQEWAQVEPSVAAFHLAFGPDDALYVTGPTVSSNDSVTRIDEYGRTSTYFKGLGRPGGLAFDAEGRLYVAASYRARRGVIRISADAARAELFVAAMNAIGVALGPGGQLAVATNDSVFSFPLGVRGTLIK